ncbi:hypothetical protein ACTWPX_21045 [Halobacillus sp. H74]
MDRLLHLKNEKVAIMHGNVKTRVLVLARSERKGPTRSSYQSSRNWKDDAQHPVRLHNEIKDGM